MKLLPMLLPLVLSGCGAKNGIDAAPASVVSSSSVWLRNSFDTDPSAYIGRFIPAGISDLDESNAMTLACSKHIGSRFVDGGGVSWTENLNVSSAVGARLGIPLVASASGSHSSSRTAKAQYTMTGKMVAVIADPDAFAACCKSQPDQCSDRYIGEFIQGSGAILHEAARSTQLSGSGTNPSSGISGSGEVGSTASWQRAAEFPQPVYFAFKVSPTPYAQGAVDTCPSWVDNPPVVDGGVYVVGHGDNAKTEQEARNQAMGNANGLAMQSAGLSGGALGGAPIPLRAESWCVNPIVSDRGQTRYAARVLGFVSHADIAAAKVQAETLAAAAREQARLDAERKAAQLAAAQEEARLAALREEARLAAEREAALRAPPPTVVTPADQPPIAPAPQTQAPPPPMAPPAGPPVGNGLERIVASIEAQSFSSDKLEALRQSSVGARVSAAEAVRVISLFAFSADQLEALQILRPLLIDPQNWSLIVDSFTFSSDKEAARALAP